MDLSNFFGQDGRSNWPDVMCYLETLGTRPNAPIVALGAVCFDMHTLELGPRYYANISLESSVRLGSVIDPNTVMWWLKQSDDARNSLTGKQGYEAASVLQGFTEWLNRWTVGADHRRPWGCGPDFDLVLLAEHYHKAGHQLPWQFWNQRCYRTLKNLYPNVEPDQRVGKHNALEDAVFQAQHIFKIRRTLRGLA